MQSVGDCCILLSVASHWTTSSGRFTARHRMIRRWGGGGYKWTRFENAIYCAAYAAASPTVPDATKVYIRSGLPHAQVPALPGVKARSFDVSGDVHASGRFVQA